MPGSLKLKDLSTTWRTLGVVARGYEFGSPGERALIECRRLIEVEVRALYGDAAWAELTGAVTGPAGDR